LKLTSLLFFVFLSCAFGQIDEKKIQTKVNSIQKPLYNPFVENYILNELKQLREENRDLKVELHETLAKKEVEISNNAINYATSTINNMFYILAAATSLLVFIGWSSVRDMNEKIKTIVDEKVSKVINKYEERMHTIEIDLEKRSRQVIQNQRAIERTNTIHSLWMRASQETTQNGKIEVYDEILELRSDDVEALIYKADSVLDLGEANWALNLTNQALQIDNTYADGYYQRAKVFSVLGFIENAIEDLQKAIELNEQYIQEIEKEDEFRVLLENDTIKEILATVEIETV
jgi:tetratricopeptide (TPR) repeat protein